MTLFWTTGDVCPEDKSSHMFDNLHMVNSSCKPFDKSRLIPFALTFPSRGGIQIQALLLMLPSEYLY